MFGQKEETGQAEVVEETSNLAGTNAVDAAESISEPSEALTDQAETQVQSEPAASSAPAADSQSMPTTPETTSQPGREQEANQTTGTDQNN